MSRPAWQPTAHFRWRKMSYDEKAVRPFVFCSIERCYWSLEQLWTREEYEENYMFHSRAEEWRAIPVVEL